MRNPSLVPQLSIRFRRFPTIGEISWRSAEAFAVRGINTARTIATRMEAGASPTQMTALGRIGEGLNAHDRPVNQARPHGEPDEALVSVGIS